MRIARGKESSKDKDGLWPTLWSHPQTDPRKVRPWKIQRCGADPSMSAMQQETSSQMRWGIPISSNAQCFWTPPFQMDAWVPIMALLLRVTVSYRARRDQMDFLATTWSFNGRVMPEPRQNRKPKLLETCSYESEWNCVSED